MKARAQVQKVWSKKSEHFIVKVNNQQEFIGI